MLDFACKKFDIHEVIKCSLGLNKSELEIITFLISSDLSHTSLDLAKSLSLDVSTLQRSLKSLHQKNLISRSQKNLSPGGYVFIYSAKPKIEITSKILSTLTNWNARVEKELNYWGKN